MSWISDESMKARQRDEDKARHDEIYQRGAAGLWSGLKHYLEQNVQLINADQDLVNRALAGDKLLIQEDGDGVKIKKLNFPAMYLTINYRHRYVEVEKVTVTNGGGERKTRKERIVYDIVIESDESLAFRNAHGFSLGVADTSQEILTPLLRTDLIK